MKRIPLFLFSLAIMAASLVAGVVYEIETTDYSGSRPQTLNSTISAEGRLLKIDQNLGSGVNNTMVFRGDRREMLIIDHKQKSYMVMDEATLKRLSDQLSQMQEQLAGLPPDQRAMFEKMMKGRLPQLQGSRAAPTEVRPTGVRETHNGYPCVRYDVFRGNEKIRELWATDWSNVAGGSEVFDVFRDMANFYRQLLENSPLGQSLNENPFSEMDQVQGFPVVTRTFDNGKLESEATLRSAERRSLDPADFEPPRGYKRRSMSGGR